MRSVKKAYHRPTLARAGSFEELTRSAKTWDNMVIFGLTGGAAEMNAVS